MGWLNLDGYDGWGEWEEPHSFGVLEIGKGKMSFDRYSDSVFFMMKTSERIQRDPLGLEWAGKGLEIPVGRLTDRTGPMPPPIGLAVSLFIELFTLTEGLYDLPLKDLISRLWRHSLRSGYLAALITEAQGGQSLSIWQSFAGGLLHDTGLLILLSQESGLYLKVVEYACSQGAELQTVEQEVFGTNHAQLGAVLLARWGLEELLVSIVGFHDEPFQLSHGRFCPATAVYLANLLDGGGIAQDGDGILSPAGKDYLLGLGLYDQLPYWQECMRDIQKKSWG